MGLKNPFQIKNGQPDYSAGVSVDVSKNYTAPIDCFLFIDGTTQNNVGSSCTINGSSVYGNWPGGEYGSATTSMIPMSKGETIVLKHMTRATMFPCKGAIQ